MSFRNYQFYVYMLANRKNGTIYIGMTNNIKRRVFEHKTGFNEGFSKRYNLHRLVYAEFYKYVWDAIRREKQLKNWHRPWKIALIEEDNPEWEDLAADWYD